MKTVILSIMVLLGMSLSIGPLVQAEQNGQKFGDTQFFAYEGPQKNWPTAEGASIIRDHAVPIFIGLPKLKYTVLGRIYDPRTSGLGIVGRGLAEGLFPERDRQRDCANQARHRGGNAIVITNHDRVLKAFNLTPYDLERTTPLFDHKDKVVLVVKFEAEVAVK